MLSRLAVLMLAPTLIQTQVALAANAPDANQRASLTVRPGVVRVVAGCAGKYAYYGDEYALVVGEIGSGYFVDSNGYVVTNAHILQPGEASGCRESLFRRFVALVTGEKDFNKISEQEKNDIQQHSQITGKIDYMNRVILLNGDSLPFETKQVGKPIAGDRDDVAVIKVKVSNVPTVRLKNVTTIEAQQAVMTLGYPLNQNFASLSEPPPLKKLPIGEPLGQAIVLSGRVAAGSQNPNGDSPVLFFDAGVPTGISGSPVINSQGNVIGMTTVSGANNGQSNASLIASGSVLKRVQQAGGNNQEGLTDRRYREGLDLLEQGNFAAAKTKFQNVKELFPYHSDADALIEDSDQGMAQAQRKQSKLLLFGVGTAAVALFALYLLLKSSKVRAITQYWLARPPAPALSPTQPDVPARPDVSIAAVKKPPSDPQPRAAVTQISGKAFNSSTVIGTQPFIELKNQAGQVRRFYLRQERHQLGRDRDWADLHTPDNGWEVLSSHQAVLEKEGTDYRLYDGDRQTASTNGIFLNGIPIASQEGHLLQDGDWFETGDDPRNQVIWTYSNPGK